MAYDTQEERLKVRGSEQITRDLKVNRDAFVLGNLEAGEVKSNGDLDVQGELIARNDLSVSGDLYFNGTEHINDTETAQTSDDYLVLRHNKTTALGANEHAGIVVHNYMPNKTATLTTDNTGTWRVADNTETETNYSNISYYNGTYYSGLGQGTTATVIDGIKSAWDEDELSECVFYNNDYYHFDGSNYFEVELSGNVMVLGTMVTDPDVITALQVLTGYDLVYFRSLTVTTISEVENEPLLTRDEVSNLSNGHFLSWDSTGNKAVDSGMSPSSFATVATSGSYNDLSDKLTIVNTVASGNMNAVTSNAVWNKFRPIYSIPSLELGKTYLVPSTNPAYGWDGQMGMIIGKYTITMGNSSQVYNVCVVYRRATQTYYNFYNTDEAGLTFDSTLGSFKTPNGNPLVASSISGSLIVFTV